MNGPSRSARAFGVKRPDPPSAPSYHDLLLGESLYTTRTIDKEWEDWLHRLWFGKFQFDAHCVGCKKPSTFRTDDGDPTATVEAAMLPGIHSRTLNCQRYGHQYAFFFNIALNFPDLPPGEKLKVEDVTKSLTKIGQIPSIQDVAGADLRPFRSVLENDDYVELNKATGLFSHGIGIGSFVYLRRIFERMIVSHKNDFESANGPVQNWDALRMDERINVLRTELPRALVDNRATYGILSKGIHELSEKQCLLFFPVVRSAIIRMLQQTLDARQQRLREEELQKELNRIGDKLRKGNSGQT